MQQIQPTSDLTRPPGQQIPIDMRNAKRRACPCGCNVFVQEVAIYTISAVVSPIGQELTVQQPLLVCMACREPYAPFAGRKEHTDAK